MKPLSFGVRRNSTRGVLEEGDFGRNEGLTIRVQFGEI